MPTRERLIEVGANTWRCSVLADGLRISSKLDETKQNEVFRVEVESDGSALSVVGAKASTLRTVPREILDWLLNPTFPHAKDCPLWRAVNGIAIACDHGYDVCPKCDPCTCVKDDKIEGGP